VMSGRFFVSRAGKGSLFKRIDTISLQAAKLTVVHVLRSTYR